MSSVLTTLSKQLSPASSSLQRRTNTTLGLVRRILEDPLFHHADFPRASQLGTGGRIIFISTTVHYMGVPLQAHVGVAKAGVDVLSHTTAIEFGPRGLTSNVIAPGPIGSTEGIERLAKVDGQVIRGIPLGRLGHVKDIADATVFLFSDAGNFVSGQTLVGESVSENFLKLLDTDLGFTSRRSGLADCFIKSRGWLQISRFSLI